ncbi:MAG: nucleotidyltransferase family protein [Bacteroidales bacterium]|nr:nucleotidyltransferase family protein [Candidatus Physcocola equi]
MKKEVHLLFALLRNALFRQPFVEDEWKNVDWNELYQIIKSHTLQTLVAESAIMLPPQSQPDAKVQSELLQLLALNMSEHSRLDADIAKVFGLLTDKGFHPILMKGQGNASFYPNPLFRKCGDADIFVGEKDYNAVCQYLVSEVEGTKASKENDKHQVVFFGKTELEIHRFAEIASLPQNNDAYQRMVERYFSSPDFVVLAGSSIPIPPHQFLPVYVFHHLWHHMKHHGVGLRQFCDVALILHRLAGKLDLNQLKEDLLSLNIMSEWQLAGNLIVDYLGLPREEFPFYKKAARFRVNAMLKLVIEDGNFSTNRHYRYKTKYLIIKKARSFFIHLPRLWCMSKMHPWWGACTFGSIFSHAIKDLAASHDK